VASLQELGFVPPLEVELELFDYVPLDSPRDPPPVELRARLARGFDDGDDDESDGEGFRLAFVAGRPVESHDLLVLSYIWRARTEAVAWGLESWSSPERRLRTYRHDPTFQPRPAADVHAELRSAGPASVAACAQRLLAS
jgi:hypothetical protein